MAARNDVDGSTIEVLSIQRAVVDLDINLLHLLKPAVHLFPAVHVGCTSINIAGPLI